MKPSLLRLAAVGLALLATATLTASAQSPYRVGQPLPGLRLPSLTGEGALDLASFRGKKLVLFEFASW